MNRTLAREWRDGRARESETDRTRALPVFTEHRDWNLPHGAFGARRPCRASLT